MEWPFLTDCLKMEECRPHGRISNAYEILAENLETTHHLGCSVFNIWTVLLMTLKQT
jgi:hypothetical protein